MQIRKAVITAAGPSQRTLPLQTLVDKDGIQKTALSILIEEVLAAGIEELCVVVQPGDQTSYKTAAGVHAGRLAFAEQQNPRGYGHAVHCARDFVGREPFLLLVGDHLYVSRSGQGCAKQLVEVAKAQQCSVSAVQATHESKLPYYGAVGGLLSAGHIGLYEVEEVLEKPTPTAAEQKLIVPGLRAGYYLCFFGMHVLTANVMDLLGKKLEQAGKGEKIPLTSALREMAEHERYLATELAGRRYDIGLKYGLLSAQLALALAGKDRDEVLTGLVELISTAPSQ